MFKGRRAERKGWLLTWSSPTGQNLTLTSSHLMLILYVCRYKHTVHAQDFSKCTCSTCTQLCASVYPRALRHVHTSADNEARHGCVIHISSHGRNCTVPEKRSKGCTALTPLQTCREWTMLLGNKVSNDTCVYSVYISAGGKKVINLSYWHFCMFNIKLPLGRHNKRFSFFSFHTLAN